MRCPDCGAALSGVPLALDGSVGGAFRCSRCGGWFMSAKTVNDLTYAKLLRYPKMGIDSRWMTSKGDKCPNDNAQMHSYRGEAVPEAVRSYQCPLCKWWWFPTDDLYTYKEAMEAKINYMRLWGTSSRINVLILPVVGLLLLVGGLGVGLSLIQQQNRTATQAASQTSEMMVTNLGNGQVIVSFKNQNKLRQIEYRKEGESEWQMVQVEAKESQVYVARLESLSADSSYELRIAGQIYKFKTY